MNNITMYHKGYCPYCHAAKQLLKKLGLTYHPIDVTNNPVEFANMVKRSGLRTVPQIFVDDKHIGGFTDLQRQVKNGTFVSNYIKKKRK